MEYIKINSFKEFFLSFKEFFLEKGWDITKKDLINTNVNSNVNFQLYNNNIVIANGYFLFKDKKEFNEKKHLIITYYNLLVCLLFEKNILLSFFNPNDVRTLSDNILPNNLSLNNKQINQWNEKDKTIHFQLQFINK